MQLGKSWVYKTRDGKLLSNVSVLPHHHQHQPKKKHLQSTSFFLVFLVYQQPETNLHTNLVWEHKASSPHKSYRYFKYLQHQSSHTRTTLSPLVESDTRQ